MSDIQPTEVTVYACGGAGSNIIKKSLGSGSVSQSGFANATLCFADTSDRNLKVLGVPKEDYYLFEGTDGSGKKRSLNAEGIKDELNRVLNRFAPSTFNIVIHSAGGGSGSVIGPNIVRELKKRGMYVISIVIGSSGSQVEIDNTINTLKSYDSIADITKSSCIISYLENGKNGAKESTIDDIARYIVSCLLVLLSGQNAPTDTADLKHWIDYTKINNGDPQLASLSIASKTSDMVGLEGVVSVATLTTDGLDTTLPFRPPYRTIGSVSKNTVPAGNGEAKILDKDPIHFIIQEDLIHASVKELVKNQADAKTAQGARLKRTRLSEGSNSNDDGMIF